MTQKRGRELPEPQLLPRHIGIIMDGNGRWAKRRGLPRTMGHRQGVRAFEGIVRSCKEIGIRYLTVYAFSTENWKRPADEVDSILGLLREYLRGAEKYRGEGVLMRFIGDRAPLDRELCGMMEQIEAENAGDAVLTVNVALNYGGRDELVRAARQLAQRAGSGALSPRDIDEAMISDALYTAGQPDPDLIIRPSGEQRTSNFMIWQAAYAELVFMDVLWPDFNREHLCEALWEYAGRNRRFGGI